MRELGQPHAVRRHRNVDVERREQLYEARHVRPYQRLAPREPDRLEAVALYADPRDPSDLLVGEQLLAGQPLHSLLGHAIYAAQVA